jgi:hypothetical protein
MKTFLWWMGWVWALPVTAAGFLFAALTLCSLDGFRSGASFWTASEWLHKNFFQRFGMGAFCWGAVIVSRQNGPLTPTGIAHELVHFKQARIFGIFLPLAYGIGALWALAQGKKAYRDNFLEKWARDEAGQ